MSPNYQLDCVEINQKPSHLTYFYTDTNSNKASTQYHVCVAEVTAWLITKHTDNSITIQEPRVTKWIELNIPLNTQ